MADIATSWDALASTGDWTIGPPPSVNLVTDESGNSIVDQDRDPILSASRAITPGVGMISGEDLQTAVLISVFTDAAASDDDVIPDGTTDPRGWWGDATIGSKLWLLSRTKRMPTTADVARGYIQAALQWLIDDQVASAIDVTTEWLAASSLGVLIVVSRFGARAVSLRFAWAWKDV